MKVHRGGWYGSTAEVFGFGAVGDAVDGTGCCPAYSTVCCDKFGETALFLLRRAKRDTVYAVHISILAAGTLRPRLGALDFGCVASVARKSELR